MPGNTYTDNTAWPVADDTVHSAPEQAVESVGGFDPALQFVLTALPAFVTKDDRLARLACSMPTLSVNPAELVP